VIGAALFTLAVGYLLGSLPSAALLARLRGTDIFQVGSHNMGAMNAARHLGWSFGAVVFALDLAKGALASALGAAWSPLDTFPIPLPAAAAGVGAVVGHLWSVWVGFRGGKGLATALGTALPLYPLGGLYGLGVLVLLTLLWRTQPGGVDRAVFVTAPLYPVLVYLSLRGAPALVALLFALSAALIALAVALKHYLVAHRPRPSEAQSAS
jgi:glycerol-3-phosphate acyltransferase PlsY